MSTWKRLPGESERAYHVRVLHQLRDLPDEERGRLSAPFNDYRLGRLNGASGLEAALLALTETPTAV